MSPSSPASAHASSPPGSRLSTLPPWPWDPTDRDGPRTLGYAAASWAEGLLIQPNGPRAKQKFEFTPDQLRFLLWWYALDEDGRWLFHHGVRRLAKGSGKSPFAAVLALIEFLAPVRLARFDDRLLGGCRGKPVDMPWVQIAATAESQTANTMRMVRAFAPKGSPVVKAYNLDPGKTVYYRQPEGTLEVITSSYTAAEGAESTFIVGDETEHWKPSNSGPELASTLEDNLAKSGARLLETANAWIPGQESVAEASFDAWVAQEEGRVRGDRQMLYDARLAPPDTDLTDGDSLREALRWIYGDCTWKFGPDGRPDIEPIVTRIWSPKAKESESRRKYLNWPSVAEDAWIAPEEWASLAEPRDVALREKIAMFFDGSKSHDATALVGCCMKDGYVFTIGVWEPRKDATVPAADVDLAVAEAFERYRVVAFFGDVREWESFVKLSWPEAYGDKLEIMAVPSGKSPESIAWDMRGHTFDFTKAVELVEAEILDREFHHDGDSRLARHVANCRRKPNRYGVSVGKESPASEKKIDAAVCMIGARMVRRLALAADGGKKKRHGTVW